MSDSDQNRPDEPNDRTKRREKRLLWSRWVFASAVGVLLGGAVGKPVYSLASEASRTFVDSVVDLVIGHQTGWGWASYVPVAVAHGGGGAAGGAVGGAVVGLMQWLVLRRQVLQARWWVLASTVGWSLGWAASETVYWLLLLWPVLWPIYEAVGWVLCGPGMMGPAGDVVVGVAVGTMQWLVLRRQVSGAYWWILASAIAWAVGQPLFRVVTIAMIFVLNSWAAFYVGWFVGLAGTGALVGAITGIILVRSLKHPIPES